MPKTLFLAVSDVRVLIEKVGLGPFTRLLADRIRSDFIRWADFQKSPRTANHSPVGVIELMPVCDADRYAFKYVNGHPFNYRLGLPTVMGFGCLAEMSTGWPLLLSEMTILTAIRTAATSAMAAEALCNPQPTKMAMIGNGAQSEFQILAFKELLGVGQVHLFDKEPSATERLKRNLSSSPGIELLRFDSIGEAVLGCEIVTTSTADKTRATILSLEMIAPGMHLNAIGGDCPGKTELQPEILRIGKVFVEFAPQARVEGEIQLMEPDFPVTELWEVLTGTRAGRESPDDVTIFDSVGFSVEDFSTLSLVYELAQENGLGTSLDLVSEMTDVRDLFGLIQP